MIIQCHGLMKIEITIVDSGKAKYLHVSVMDTINNIGRSFYLDKDQLRIFIEELQIKFGGMSDG